MWLFSLLQATGPILTPQNAGAAIWRLPPGGAPHYKDGGYISYRDAPNGTPGGHDHTGLDDHKEIYWLCTDIGGGDAEGEGDTPSRCQAPESYDRKGGYYVPTYGGKRFRNGEWPKGDPPIFPEYKP
jgi:hypothetical protein